MADGQLTMLLAQATAMMDEVYDLGIIPLDNRFGLTAQHIKRETDFVGGKMHKKFETMIFTGARANQNLEASAPDAYRINLTDVEIDESDLRQLTFTLKYGIMAGLELKGEHAAINLAEELARQSQQSVGEKRNQMLNQDANMVKALVAALYDEDGTTYGNSSNKLGFVKIDNGSISAFHPGEIIDIRVASSAVIRTTATVKDVIHSTHLFGNKVGPGLTLEIDTAAEAYASSTLGDAGGAVDDNLTSIVDGDEIVSHGEIDNDGYPSSFSSLIDLGATPGDYFGMTRTDIGNHYLVPYGRDYAVDGANQTLNVDTHFGEMSNILGMVFSKSRQYRESKGFKLTKAIIAQAQPDLVADVARGAGDGTAQFQRKIAADFAGGEQPLVSVAGWNGSVLHSESVPPIALQSEPLAPANKIRIFMPECLEWIRLGGPRPRFIKAPGGPTWHVVIDPDTGRLTKELQASAFVTECLFCNQPQLMYGIHGVKSSV